MFDDALQPIREALASGQRAAGRLPVGGLDARMAREAVLLGERLERLGRGLKLAAAARVADTGAWAGDGDRSMADWVARTTGTSKAEAQRAVETGQQLAALPATAAALAEGRVSPRQAEAIAGAAAVAPEAEGTLLAEAGRAPLHELQTMAREVRAHADPDPEATERRIHRKRTYRTWTDADGTGHLQLSGPRSTIARIDAAVRQRCDRLFRESHRAGRREPSEALAFDAVEQLVCREGDGQPVAKGADAKIIVRIDHAALVRGRADSGEVCEISGVGPVPVSTVREWMDDAFVAAVLTKGTEISKVVHLGRRFTSEQRTALQWHNPTCARRGCGNRLGLENDHLDDWALTHTTRTVSGKRWCRACHRLKSSGWTVGPMGDDGKHELFPPPERRPAPTAAPP